MRVLSLLVVVLFSAGVAMADDQALDVTIDVVESPTDRAGAVTKSIQLPPAGAQKSRESAVAGNPADERKKSSVQKEQQAMKKAARANPKKAARSDVSIGKTKQKSQAKKKQS